MEVLSYLMSRIGIWVCDVSGSQWRRHWEDPCSSCEAREAGECPGGIFDDDDDPDEMCFLTDDKKGVQNEKE